MERSSDVPEITAAATVAAYLPDDGELDPGPLLELVAGRGAAVHLPSVDRDDVMRFGSWDGRSPLKNDRWGIPAPGDRAERRTADRLDVVITPLVAVDRDGTRIGRGAGYYDRALAHRLDRAGRPAIIGYAHHFQLVDDALARHEWDVPLDVLVTDREVRRWERHRT